MLTTISVTLLFVVSYLVYSWRKRVFSKLEELNIPGPKPNLIFGNLLDFSRSKNILELQKEWQEKYGKIYGYYLGAYPVIAVTDAEVLKQIQIKDFNNFVDRPTYFQTNESQPTGPSMIFESGQRWKDIRNVLTPSFTTGKMKSMLPIMSSAADDLIHLIKEQADQNKEFEIFRLYKKLTMDVISRTALGRQGGFLKSGDDELVKAAKILIDSNAYSYILALALCFPEFKFILSPLFNLVSIVWKNKGVNPAETMQKYVKEVIKARKMDEKLRRKDILQFLIDAKAPEKPTNISNGTNENTSHAKESSQQLLNDEEVVGNAALMLLAGYETTSNALAFTTHMIVNHPDVQEKLYQEIKTAVEENGEINYNIVQTLPYLDQVFTESIRFYPPVHQFVEREVTSPSAMVGPYKVPKGTYVTVPAYIVQHDPEYWSDPDTFDPERFSPENKKHHHPMAYQTFGNGPRNCIGMRFAQMEAKLALTKVLLQYKLVPGEKTEKEPIQLLIMMQLITPANGVWLKAVHRES